MQNLKVGNKIIGPVWVTKYALTKGIKRYDEVEHCTSINERMIIIRGQWQVTYHGEEWHLTKAGAIKRAKQMRERKILSINKQITRLQALTFECE